MRMWIESTAKVEVDWKLQPLLLKMARAATKPNSKVSMASIELQTVKKWRAQEEADQAEARLWHRRMVRPVAAGHAGLGPWNTSLTVAQRPWNEVLNAKADAFCTGICFFSAHSKQAHPMKQVITFMNVGKKLLLGYSNQYVYVCLLIRNYLTYLMHVTTKEIICYHLITRCSYKHGGGTVASGIIASS